MLHTTIVLTLIAPPHHYSIISYGHPSNLENQSTCHEILLHGIKQNKLKFLKFANISFSSQALQSINLKIEEILCQLCKESKESTR